MLITIHYLDNKVQVPAMLSATTLKNLIINLNNNYKFVAEIVYDSKYFLTHKKKKPILFTNKYFSHW